ncbi:MAG TPA: hypothetical protein VGH83_04740 [Candidatus Acidoferrum sp.]
MPPKKPSRPSRALKFEYVTSTVSMLKGDGIVVHVVNDSATGESARVIIYQNTGAGAVVAVDTGITAVAPTWQWGLGFTLPSSGEYWARIHVSSEFLIPKASFERYRDSVWVPVVSYRPGDFAIFKLPVRKRIW